MADADLTAVRLRELLDYDPETGDFTNRITRNNNGARAGEKAGTLSNGYVAIGLDGVNHRANRLAWLYMTGEWPKAFVDHKNRIKSDNRWENLRELSNTQNMQNVAKPNANNSTGYRGVMPHGSGFRAQIVIDGKTRSLGTFRSPEQAHAAYLSAKVKHHPGFAA